ncbi:MAG: hypothetical protein GF418_16855, partial [Chitinivibrionales bacterium]|nr:hypothetical protein [Chitinivibrionales bacterium]MBD3397291.1 hypothetical protein [Chitinivibrionales bacterium]
MKSSFIAGVLVIAALVAAARAQSFGDIFQQKSGITSDFYSTAAFGDYNNDGYIDIAVTASRPNYTSGTIYLYTNNPSDPGSFSRSYLAGGPSRQVAWADFNNDGYLDLYANNNTRNYMWVNSGPPNFDLNVFSSTPPASSNQQGAGWLDINQDGYLDLFISSEGTSRVHMNNGNGGFNANAWTYGSTPNGSYTTTADYDNDGDQDLFYAADEVNDNNRIWLWQNNTSKNGLPSFQEVGASRFNNVNAPTQNQSIAWTGIVNWDPDVDGDMDIFVGWSNGYYGVKVRDQFFRNDNGSFAELTSQEFTQGARYTGGVAAADVNNDGLEDLYVAHDEENHRLYINQGNLSFQRIDGATHSTQSNETANGVTFGDVDNDGDLDMFLCNGGKLYLNQTNSTDKPAHKSNTPRGDPAGGGNQEHYLGVMVSGAGADSETGEARKTKDGIGARVYLFHMADPDEQDPSYYDENDLVGTREIDGGSGYGSQATQVQHFGLSTNLPHNASAGAPHFEPFAVKVIFLDGTEKWRYNVVPESVHVEIDYANGTKTTYIDQTIEISLLDSTIVGLELEVEPDVDSIGAGTEVGFSAHVLVEVGSRIDTSASYSQQTTWELVGNSANDPLSGGAGPSRTNTFTGTRAYETYTITATFVDSKTGDTFTASRDIKVGPGPASEVVVELVAAAQKTETDVK